MAKTLDTVLADYRSDADALERTGHATDAKLIRQLCRDVELSAEDFIVFLSETDAQMWSGKKQTFLRNHFPMWERLGHAKWSNHGRRIRLYRRCILPRRAQIDKIAADADRAARGEDNGVLAA